MSATFCRECNEVQRYRVEAGTGVWFCRECGFGIECVECGLPMPHVDCQREIAARSSWVTRWENP